MKGKKKMASFLSIGLLSLSYPAALPRSAHVSQSSNTGPTAVPMHCHVYIDVYLFPNTYLADYLFICAKAVKMHPIICS